LRPFIRNGHLQTLLGNFWSRPVTEDRFPLQRRLYQTEPDVQVAVDEQLLDRPIAHAVLVHGLEGSSKSGYIRSVSRDLLEAGISVHRFNMRSCGGTEDLAATNYHAGQTTDLRHVIEQIRTASGLPVLLIGYSLGGNASLKLAGELGREGRDLLAGVCAVSTPINLEACADQLNRRANFIYQRRFLIALKDRIRRRHRKQPDKYDVSLLGQVRSIWDFDDNYTAKLFGFGTARNYFRTQSSGQFIQDIQIPCLIVQAKDDPMIPFQVYEQAKPIIDANPNITFLAFDHGGHVGFVSRDNPRFWIDPIITRWAVETGNKSRQNCVSL
jgi:predicted alpha/beta-fold hydrolase